ncbi:hypothetical protein ACOMHN_053294 [Nucella lapillus]
MTANNNAMKLETIEAVTCAAEAANLDKANPSSDAAEQTVLPLQTNTSLGQKADDTRLVVWDSSGVGTEDSFLSSEMTSDPEGRCTKCLDWRLNRLSSAAWPLKAAGSYKTTPGGFGDVRLAPAPRIFIVDVGYSRSSQLLEERQRQAVLLEQTTFVLRTNTSLGLKQTTPVFWSEPWLEGAQTIAFVYSDVRIRRGWQIVPGSAAEQIIVVCSEACVGLKRLVLKTSI